MAEERRATEKERRNLGKKKGMLNILIYRKPQISKKGMLEKKITVLEQIKREEKKERIIQ